MSTSELKWELEQGIYWKTALQTSFWRGFVGTPFPEDIIDPESVHVYFAAEGRDKSPLTSEDLIIISWLRDNHDGVANAVLSNLLLAYPAIKKEIEGLEDDDLAKLMPTITTIKHLEPLISLRSIFVHQITKADVPYLGFEFDCVWEQEHGLGVLMNGLRLVEIGGVDTACMLWVAERDSKRFHPTS